MSSVKYKIIGKKELEMAIRKNPQRVHAYGREFLNRGLMTYRRIIEGSPWQVGQSGGGVPRDSRDLMRSHDYKIKGLTGIVDFAPNPNRGRSNAPYGIYVHEGTRKMEARPWLNYAQDRGEIEIKKHYKTFLEKVVKDLAK